jgi:plasmid stabilization system protein ParE
MEKEIIITKRFRNNTLRVYQYLLKEFSAKTAQLFLDKVTERIELIARYPTIGKASQKKKNIRSIILIPHNQIFYRYQNNRVEILCLFDMRKARRRSLTDLR